MDLLKSIRIFKQVAEEQSFSRAAATLNLVPSAVSRQINELEKWLGVRLINRTTRSLHLTSDGRVYLQKMELISAQVDAMKSMQRDSRQLQGRVRITAPMMLGQYVLPDALAIFKQQHAQVQLSLSLMNRKVDLVEEGFDLALRAGHLADANFIARPLGRLPFKTVANQTYLNHHGYPNHPKELSAHHCLINTGVSQPKRWTYQIDGKATSIKVNGDLETNESLCLLAFALKGHGIALLPDRYVNNKIASGELVEILTDYAPQPLPINLIYPSQRLSNPTTSNLINFLIDYFRNNPNAPIEIPTVG